VTLEPALPETRERRCPSCQSEQIVYAGRIIGAGGMVKVERRCEACGTAFLFVRERLHWWPSDSLEQRRMLIVAPKSEERWGSR
jgi:hypothetical protein